MNGRKYYKAHITHKKTEGKPYKTNGKGNVECYNTKRTSNNNKGDRHPHSILQFPNDSEYQNNSNHEMVYVFKDKQGTYNPQKTEGKPYKQTQGKQTDTYGINEKTRVITDNKGDRHPSTILKFNNPKKSLHRTMKPTDLCEWLIKSYSNEGELVLDFTLCGSGTTGIACLNTGRRFIGIEKDDEIFKVAYHRIFKHELEMYVKSSSMKNN